MAEVIWTPQARRDVEAIVTYYLEVAPSYADVVEGSLLASTRRLETFPRSGRAVPEIGDEAIREVVWREYRVIHFVDAVATRVEVLAPTPGQRGGAEGRGRVKVRRRKG